MTVGDSLNTKIAELTGGIGPTKVGLTMARRGMLGVDGAHRSAFQLAALRRWRFGLAGELRQAAARSPRAVAIIDDEEKVTYAQLLDRSERIAAVLAARGFGEGDRIGLLARNHAWAVAFMCATSALGADVVLGNTGLAPQQFAVVAQQQEIAFLVHDDEFANVAAELPEGIGAMSESELREAVAATPQPPRMTPPARVGRTIILTSGTTGTPKGAARRTPGGFGPLISIIDRIPLHARDRILIAAPIFHTWGYAAMQLSIAMRSTMVMQRRYQPESAIEAMVRNDVQAVFAIPVMLQRMVDQVPDLAEHARRLAKLRVIATSGSAYPSGFTTRFMDAVGDVLYNLYGSTEASWVAIATPQDLRRDPDTAGTPPLGTVVRIVDGDGNEVPEGEKGRIFCGNELVFDGYTSGADKDRMDGLVATGDLGYVKDGLYFVAGREDDMIVSGGENVYPAEVESLLVQHPAVQEVSVVGVPDPEFGQRLAAFVVVREGESLEADEVRELVRAERARHCIPREVVFLDELPRNATGKVLARELRKHFT